MSFGTTITKCELFKILNTRLSLEVIDRLPKTAILCDTFTGDQLKNIIRAVQDLGSQEEFNTIAKALNPSRLRSPSPDDNQLILKAYNKAYRICANYFPTGTAEAIIDAKAKMMATSFFRII